MNLRQATLSCLCSGLLLTTSVGAQTFQGVGIEPGQSTSQGLGISGDGTTMVLRDGTEASLWTNGSRTALGASYAEDASFDGGVAVGGLGFNQAARWEGSWRTLGYLAAPGSVPFMASLALGVSATGEEVAGFSTNSQGIAEAFLWTASTNTMQGLGFLGAIPRFSAARGISADGSLVVGDSEYTLGFYEAMAWTQSSGMRGLGYLPGDQNSRALGISADGSVIVGYSGPNVMPAAAMWPAGAAAVPLGPNSPAYDASADGGVIVGGDPNAPNSEAWVWTAATGSQNLRALLAAGGAPVAGWTLQVAHAISDDGCTVAGTGINPSGATEGFVATIDKCADLKIEKRVLLAPGAQVLRQAVVSYHLQVTASGSATTQSFVVEDILPSPLGLLEFATTNGSFDPVTGLWTSADPLPPGATANLVLQVQADDPALEPFVENCAQVLEVDGVAVNPTAPGHESCVKFDYKHSTQGRASVLTTKEGKVVGAPGAYQIIYSIKVGNSGPVPSPVMVADVIQPALGLTFAGASMTAGSYDPTLGVWDVGIVSLGQSEQLLLTFDVPPSYSGSVENLVFTSSPETEATPADNSAALSLLVP